MEQLTLSLGEPPASHSASRETGKGLTMQGVALCSTLQDLYTRLSQSGLCGKTSRAACHQEKGGISRHSFLACAGGTLLSPRTDGGAAGLPPITTAEPTGSHGGYLTLNTPEWTDTLAPCRRDEGVCGLSDILEIGNVLPKYFLSARACAGILRRADKRGKALPPILERMLRFQSGCGRVAKEEGKAR